MSDAETTAEKQQVGVPFVAGQSGNPAGRPKGSRNKLGEAFIAALHDDFQEHGIETIARVRQEDPVAYVKVCAGLLPKEIKISDERELSDDELNSRIKQLVTLFDAAGIEIGTSVPAGGEEAPLRH